MQDPDAIRRFTSNFIYMKDPPFLPMALWFAAVPALVRFGGLGVGWSALLFLLALVGTTVASRWYARTYGTVVPADVTGQHRWRKSTIAVLIAVFVLEGMTSTTGFPVKLGMIVFSGWLAWGAWKTGGFRWHLFVMAAIVFALSFVPMMFSNEPMQRLVFVTGFGAGWAFVCVRDHLLIVRHFAHEQR